MVRHQHDTLWEVQNNFSITSLADLTLDARVTADLSHDWRTPLIESEQ